MSFLWMFIITVVILQASVFVTTIYLHRAMCHRGLELHPLVANLMHLHLSLFYRHRSARMGGRAPQTPSLLR